MIIMLPISAIIIKVLSLGVRQDVFNIGKNYLPVPVPVPVATRICSQIFETKTLKFFEINKSNVHQ